MGVAPQLKWFDPPLAEFTACPLCLATERNHVFLQVAESGHSVSRGHPVKVARCGTCAAAWFPGIEVSNSYPEPGAALEEVRFWQLVDHYVEMTSGLDWKIAFTEQLPFATFERVLEVGCNTGVLLDYCRRVWGAEVVGLEPSAYGVAGAQRFGLPIRADYMDAYLAASPGQFDLVVTTEVIEHVADPARFLAEIRALTRPGGVVLLTTPNAEGLTAGRAPGELFAMLSVGAHQFLLSAGRLEELARAAGFAWSHVRADPTTLVAVLADHPIDLAPHVDPLPRLVHYYDARLADGSGTTRARLSDLIRRYVVARELGLPDATRGEAEIDAVLAAEFGVDVHDLGPLVERAESTGDIFDVHCLAPFSLPRYLFWRGHRDDLPEVTRTEMWEAAVVLIGRGLAADPVNLFLLDQTLGPTLTALHGRVSGRWNPAARDALAGAARDPGDLPVVRPSIAWRARRLAARAVRGAWRAGPARS